MVMPYPRSMQVPAPQTLKEAHPGLIFSHLFNGYVRDFSDLEGAKRDNRRNVELSDPKKDFMRLCNTGQSAWQNMGEQILLQQAQMIQQLGGEFMVVSSVPGSPFLTGIGVSHPLENGFLWHSVYPCPYVPGSSLKGLLRAWFETSPALADDEKRTLIKALFGSDHKDPKAAETEFANGGIVFFDALPVSDWKVEIQMLTPHMGKYYEKGRKHPDQWDTCPADWHQPIPVPFMALDRISLLIGFAPSSTGEPLECEQQELLKAHLLAALSELGLGAKTSLGYGRFQLDAAQTAHFEQQIAEALEKEEQRAMMAALSAEEQEILKLKKALQNMQSPQTWEPGQSDFTIYFKPVLDQMETVEDINLLNRFVCEVLTLWIEKTGKSNYWKGGKAKGKKSWPRIAQAFSARNCN